MIRRSALLSAAALVILAGCVGDPPDFTHCPEGQIDCEGACIDPGTDWKHCGATDCRVAGGEGTACAENGYCSEGQCLESYGAFVSPGNPGDGETMEFPREVEFQISWAEPRRIRYTTDGSAPLAGSPATTETDAPVTIAVAPDTQVRFFAIGDKAERSFRLVSGGAAEAGVITERATFSKSASATMVAKRGEQFAFSGTGNCWAASSGTPNDCGLGFAVATGNVITGCRTVTKAYDGVSGPVFLPGIAPMVEGVYYVHQYVGPASTDEKCHWDGSGLPVARVVVRQQEK